MILSLKMVKEERKDAHTPDKKNKHKPRAYSPGEGCGSKSITTPDRSRIRIKTRNRESRGGKDRELPCKRRYRQEAASNGKSRQLAKAFPRRHLVQNPAKNRINSNNTTPDDMKPPKDTNQETDTREWKKLKIIFRRMIVPEIASHVNANIGELVSTGKAQSKKNQEEEELIAMTWEPQGPSQ
ncbi:unnamed protein product [Lactuca virosa]|uniref:Uncharacterized protein n=1 Tax=Lactuca virosa TaxID=75947 RepID=A0AAU9P169_9ASTR|nr:unnamed protein product [Lactuca virosa]